MRQARFVAVLAFLALFSGGAAAEAEEEGAPQAAKAKIDPSLLTLKDLFDGGRKFTKPIPAWSWRPGHKQLVRLDMRKPPKAKGKPAKKEPAPTKEVGAEGAKKKKKKGPPPKPILVTMDPETGATRDLLDLSTLNALVPDPKPGKDGKPRKKKVTAMRAVGRRSARRFTWSKSGNQLCVVVKGDLVWVDLETGTRRRLTQTETPMSDLNIAPNGAYVSFSRDNELWVVSTGIGKPYPVTAGASKTLLNGTLDWVYPEELGFRTAAWWSPDSTMLAYLQMDQTGVPTYRVPGLLPLRSDGRTMRYPKAGDPNPKVRVGVVRACGGRTRWVRRVPSPSSTIDMEYVVRVGWHEGREVPDFARASPWVLMADRSQRHYHLFHGGMHAASKHQTGWGWTSPPPAPRFPVPGLMLSRQTDSNGTRWFRHDARPGATPETRLMPLTAHREDAGRLLHFDKQTWRVIYTAIPRGSNTPGVFLGRPGVKALEPAPFGEDLSKATSASIDESGTYALVTTSDDLTPPRTVLTRVSDGEVIRQIGDARSDVLDDIDLATPEYGAVPLGDKGRIRFRLWKPHDFDPQKKYGLIVSTYGGPGSRSVRAAWGRTALAATMWGQRGFLLLQADGRGTSGQGVGWEYAVYGKLGVLEIDDQATAVKHILKRGYVDPERVGIWGWSYGGTMACNALTMRGDVFKAGVAVAPVTDWRLYDSIYTERYMGLPKDNPKGYKQSSSITHAKKMTGHLLLMHGMGDDNVHAQNTMRLVEAFIKAKITTYDVHLYPKRGHGIGGATLDVFTRLVTYFERHIGPKR